MFTLFNFFHFIFWSIYLGDLSHDQTFPCGVQIPFFWITIVKPYRSCFENVFVFYLKGEKEQFKCKSTINAPTKAALLAGCLQWGTRLREVLHFPNQRRSAEPRLHATIAGVPGSSPTRADNTRLIARRCGFQSCLFLAVRTPHKWESTIPVWEFVLTLFPDMM